MQTRLVGDGLDLGEADGAGVFIFRHGVHGICQQDDDGENHDGEDDCLFIHISYLTGGVLQEHQLYRPDHEGILPDR